MLGQENDMDLADFIQQEMQQRGWSHRDAVREIEMSSGALTKILKRETKQPELDTLEHIAQALQAPLWRVIEMAGFDLQLPATPSSLSRRLQSLLEREPAYQHLAEHLLNLHPDDLNGILTYLEAQELQRKRGANAARKTEQQQRAADR
ncbi:MAG: XRE family transcriptional regulator [Chloroflexaceae bacterium]|nr:XRE family transcriptional regulator [Chloroflexaceae bacterium]